MKLWVVDNESLMRLFMTALLLPYHYDDVVMMMMMMMCWGDIVLVCECTLQWSLVCSGVVSSHFRQPTDQLDCQWWCIMLYEMCNVYESSSKAACQVISFGIDHISWYVDAVVCRARLCCCSVQSVCLHSCSHYKHSSLLWEFLA